MKLRRTKHLGVTLNVRSAFHAELTENIQAAAAESGYEIVLSIVTPTHDESRAIETLLGFRCESVILLGSQLPKPRLRELARELPLVLVGRRVDLDNVDVVRSADHRGQALVVAHLAGLGHRDIVHVDGGHHPISALRRQGYRAAMRRHGLDHHVRVITGGLSERDGHHAVAELLRHERLPTAVCAFNDHCALGVIDALAKAGVRVPGDCSVTGYDDSPVAQLTAVDLTSVSQEAAVLAQSAVRAAVDRLEGRVTGTTDAVLKPRLVVRGSSAPPNRQAPRSPACPLATRTRSPACPVSRTHPVSPARPVGLAWIRVGARPETTSMAHRCRKNNIDGPSMLFAWAFTSARQPSRRRGDARPACSRRPPGQQGRA
jgi:LacI family transcriptional regulator